MELRQLRYFAAVAQHLHYGHAARALHMAQPPLSQQIRRLEEDLGVELFRRTSRKVELTEAGQELLPSVHRVLAAAESMQELANGLRTGSSGSLRIGYAASVLNWGLATSLRAFRQRFPDIVVSATQMPVINQVEAIRDGQIDVGFTVARIDFDFLQVQTLSIEPLIVLLPVDHPLVEKPRVNLADLSQETFLRWRAPYGRNLDDFVTRACAAAGFTPTFAYQGPESHTMAHMVAAGFGVCLMPRCDRLLQTPGVAFKDLTEPAPWTVLSAVAPRWSPKPTTKLLMSSLPSIDIDDAENQM